LGNCALLLLKCRKKGENPWDVDFSPSWCGF
jgi:hypothetical protein